MMLYVHSKSKHHRPGGPVNWGRHHVKSGHHNVGGHHLGKLWAHHGGLKMGKRWLNICRMADSQCQLLCEKKFQSHQSCGDGADGQRHHSPPLHRCHGPCHDPHHPGCKSHHGPHHPGHGAHHGPHHPAHGHHHGSHHRDHQGLHLAGHGHHHGHKRGQGSHHGPQHPGHHGPHHPVHGTHRRPHHGPHCILHHGPQPSQQGHCRLRGHHILPRFGMASLGAACQHSGIFKRANVIDPKPSTTPCNSCAEKSSSKAVTGRTQSPCPPECAGLNEPAGCISPECGQELERSPSPPNACNDSDTPQNQDRECPTEANN